MFMKFNHRKTAPPLLVLGDYLCPTSFSKHLKSYLLFALSRLPHTGWVSWSHCFRLAFLQQGTPCQVWRRWNEPAVTDRFPMILYALMEEDLNTFFHGIDSLHENCVLFFCPQFEAHSFVIIVSLCNIWWLRLIVNLLSPGNFQTTVVQLWIYLFPNLKNICWKCYCRFCRVE